MGEVVKRDELSNHYGKVEFNCCGHPKLHPDSPICTNCWYQWYSELYRAVNSQDHD